MERSWLQMVGEKVTMLQEGFKPDTIIYTNFFFSFIFSVETLLGNDSNVCGEISLIISLMWPNTEFNKEINLLCWSLLFVAIVFPVYHFLKFYLPTKHCHGCWQKEWTTKDCGLSSHDCCSDFVILALHIKRISIWECGRDLSNEFHNVNFPTEIHE